MDSKTSGHPYNNLTKTVKGFALFIFLLMANANVHALPETNTIKFENCTLLLPGTTRTAQARCGWLEVAENPDEPAGSKIKLHVALAPAASRSPKPDPLFLFAGGPGQAASEAYVGIQPILEKIRKDRDIVLIDQRGTGHSNPLKCPVDETDLFETTIDLELVARRSRECLENLKGDPRFYTTTIAMQDYEQVRQAMGYEKINIYGGSYGTRSSQVYLRLYPDKVRSIILDSIVPMELILGTEHAKMLDRSVMETFKDCRDDEVCNEYFSEGINGLNQLIRDLRDQPREITFTQPATGKQQSLAVTADIMAVAIRFLSYSSETQAVLPLLIHEAVTTGNLQRLTSQALMIVSGLMEQLSHGMELSVICSEDYPYMTGDQDDSDSILGNTLLDAMKTECVIWPKGDIPDNFHEPVVSDVPALMITGTRDPVTPPVYAEQTARHYSNSLLLTAQGLGHSVIVNPCLRGIAAEFVELGSVDNLNTSCVANIKPAPFFTSILGPGP